VPCTAASRSAVGWYHFAYLSIFNCIPPTGSTNTSKRNKKKEKLNYLTTDLRQRRPLFLHYLHIRNSDESGKQSLYPDGDVDRHQNVIICSLAHCQRSLQISCRSVWSFLRKVANKQSDKQTNNDVNITFHRTYLQAAATNNMRRRRRDKKRHDVVNEVNVINTTRHREKYI